MVFNSYTFFVFLPLVIGLHSLPLSWMAKKRNLLIASYLFYMAWNPPFVVLLWFSTAIDWFCARAMHRTDDGTRRRLFLSISLAGNLGLLAFFKYGGFVLENLVTVLGSMGVDYQPATVGIVLPVGISFYTFQTLSYTIDIYRRQRRPWHSFIDYALYVTFFPQLVSGPIVRSSEFLPQLVEPKQATGPQFAWGLSLFVLGLFEKSVVADGWLAPVVERVYDTDLIPSAFEAWVGTLAFSGQLFCDFAGYSTCAIGVALCLGFRLPQNFRFPYAAVGFADFWRRWHITLSTWLRDYAYIPLGGSRVGAGRTYANILVVMVAVGLWHGAAWTFVVWGAVQGALLAGERAIRRALPGRVTAHSTHVQLLLAAATYVSLSFTFALFRAGTFGRARTVIMSMLTRDADTTAVLLTGFQTVLTGLVIGSMLVIHWAMRDRSLEDATRQLPWWARAGILSLLIVAIVTISGEDRAFIYFQF